MSEGQAREAGIRHLGHGGCDSVDGRIRSISRLCLTDEKGKVEDQLLFVREAQHERRNRSGGRSVRILYVESWISPSMRSVVCRTAHLDKFNGSVVAGIALCGEPRRRERVRGQGQETAFRGADCDRGDRDYRRFISS